jgi:sterol 14-demethylase
MMLLLQHRQCLAKVMKEQNSVLGKDMSSKELDYDSVGNMEYLQNCVKESLRLFPPLIMLMRMAKQDIPTTCNGKQYIIPKGDIVIASPAVASRMSSVFKNPDAFEPERFEPERNEQAAPYSYLGTKIVYYI